MNNDLNNNHSSMSSNNYIANRRRNPIENQYFQEYYNTDKNRGMFDNKSKGNRTIFFDSDNDKRPSNQKDLLISQQISKYPTNYAPGPNPYNAEIIRGYILGNQEDPRYNNQYQNPLKENEENYDAQRNNYYRPNIKNGGEIMQDEDGNFGEDEEEMENGNENNFNEEIDFSPQQPIGRHNPYIGDGIVRNNIPEYSPDSNGQKNPYYKKKNLGKYMHYYGPENENEEIKYITGSPEENYNMKNYNNNNQPYKKRRILGNLGDSASSEAYAKKNIQISPSNPSSSSRIYVKPRTQYNNMNNGISTEERGIESRDSPINADNNGAFIRRPFQNREQNDDKNKFNRRINIDKDFVNLESPLYNYQSNDINKGGKVDLNNFAIMKKRGKREKEEEEEDIDKEEVNYEEEKKMKDKYKIDEERLLNIINLQKAIKNFMEERRLAAIKIQSLWRGRCTRKIMKLYLDLDEFIYLLSKVHFNHFSDNFYFFINQLFNVFRANTLDNNQMEFLDDENEGNDNINNLKEDEKFDENNPNNKKYEDLLNDYNNLQKKYNDLINENKFNKSATKKSLLNNDMASLRGETSIGTIKTNNNKLKFKNNNNSAITVKNNENLTFSNDNEDPEVKKKERHFYTPNQDDDDSFNEKDKRFSYSSIHSEENSKYFDNENLKSNKKKKISFKNKDKNPKVTMLILKKTKENLFTYSPSTENDKQSRENSKKKKNNDSINDNKINNISVIMPKHEEEFGILKSEPEKNEGKIYDKYVRSFSKDLCIVKNNKIGLKNDKNNKDLYKFDNELIYPENENNMELVAPKKSDTQKIKEIFDNQKLLKKIENRISRKNFPEQKLIKKNESSFSVKHKTKEIFDNIFNEIETNINNLEIIQNTHRNFNPSKLDFESNELSLGEPQLSQRKKKNNKPIFENEINIKKIPVEKYEAFSKEKTLPSFNVEDESNKFTIKNKVKKNESKPKTFNNDEMIVDNIFNYKFKFNDSKLSPKKENEKEKENLKREKEIIYVPIKNANAFKRLRRSKRTKETYFTIKKNIDYNKNNNKLEETKGNDKNLNKNKDILKIDENHFAIKSEYYYIETDDKQIPEIIQKNIEKTIIIDKNNGFDNDKVLLSKENNFNIKADKNKNKYLEDIEKNELMIPSKSKDKKLKKDKYDDKKRWEDLNPIANDEFSIGNDLDDNENNIYENINNEGEENEGFNDQNIYINEFIDIEPTQQFEIIDEIKEKNKNKKELMKKSNQNSINIDGIALDKEDKELQVDIRSFQITTKKILKQETILSKKKFLDNKISFEESFPISGINNKNINYISDKDDEKNRQNQNTNNEDNKKKLILFKEPICELTFKKIKKKTKDKEIEAQSGKKFDDINPITNNEFIIKKKPIQKEEKETEIADDLNDNEDNQSKLFNKIRKDNITIKGKNKKMKDSETQIDDNFNKLEPYYNNEIMISDPTYKKENNIIIKNERIGIIAPEKELENKDIILEQEKINEINLESRNRAFPKLDINNYLSETFKQNKKGQNKFELNKELLIDNNQLTILPKKSKRKFSKKNKIPENKEEIQRNFYDLNINKSEEYNVKGKEKEIKKKEKKKKMVESETQIDDDLINDNYQKEKNINNDNKIFSNINIEKCNEQIIYGEKKIKEKLEYENPQTNNLDIAKEKRFEIKGYKTNNVEKEVPELNEEKSNKDDSDKNELLCLENAINSSYKPKTDAYNDTDKNKRLKNPRLEIQNNNEIEITNEKDLLNRNELNKEIKINDQFTINKKKKKKLIEKSTEITDDLFQLNEIQNDEFSLLKSLKEKKEEKETTTISSPLFEAKENDLNIKSKKNKKLDKEIQIEPDKELDINTKINLEKQANSKRKFLDIENYKADSFSLNSEENISKAKVKDELNKPEKVSTCSVATQTPKLRPANKTGKNVIFHEIKTIIKKEKKPREKFEIANSSKYKLAANQKKDKADNKIIINEKDEDKEKDEEDKKEKEEEEDNKRL